MPTGGGAATAGGVVSHATIEHMSAGEHVSVDASQVRSTVAAAADRQELVNLANLHVDNADHGNLFDYSSTELPREAMPQVPGTAEHIQSFSEFLGSKGLEAKLEQVSPHELHATQNQLDADKVESVTQWMESDGGKGAASQTLISSVDGSILDGHHRWGGASVYAIDHPDYTFGNLRVNTDIQTLLGVAREYDQIHGIASTAIDHPGYGAGVQV